MKYNKVKIGDFVTLRQGLAINKKTNHYISNIPTNFNLLKISDMKDNSFSTYIKETIPERYLAKKDDIIFTRTGVVGLVFRNQYGIIHNNCFSVTSLDKQVLLQDFLYYALQEKEFHAEVLSRATGAAQPDLSHESFNSIYFYLPPIAKQKKIISILDSYNFLIENNQKQIKLLEEVAEKLYKEWFIKLNYPNNDNSSSGELPSGWKKEKLINLVDVQYGFAFDGSKFNTEKKGNPIIRIRNIPTGETADYTTEEAPDNYIIHNGDILVGMDGEFHINTWNQQDAYLVQRACSFRPHKEFMKGYIFEAIKRPIKFFEKTLVGSTVSHLGKKHIDSIEIITGPDELYIPFDNLYKKRQILQNQIQLLQEARDKLLPKLMNGDIEV